MKAVWNGVEIARSSDTVQVEGNHYFPPSSVDSTYLEASEHHTVCHWKGTASYFDIVVDGMRNRNAAWYYPSPKPEAEMIRDRIAFWKGVDIVEDADDANEIKMNA